MQTTMSLHEVRWFFKTSFSRVLLFFSAARVNRRLANVSGSDLILLLLQCELAGQPSDESRMNHSHDSRSKTEAHRPTSFFFFYSTSKETDTCRRATAEIKPLGIHCFLSPRTGREAEY